MNQPLFTRNGIPAVRAGKAVQNALRGSVDMSAARTAAAGGVQPSGNHAKSCSGYHQRQPERAVPQKKNGNHQDEPRGNTGINRQPLSLPSPGNLLIG
ncbi:hypothetical protein JQM66_11250 [Oscillibacter valericigenes]|nr:hypothetical protein [Oscillibacter valericigenes]